MNRTKLFFWGPLLLALTACGGGGDNAGDVSTFSVVPAGFTWTRAATCPDMTPGGGDSIHTINGGQAPFRVRSANGLTVGLASAANAWVAPPAGMLNAEGDLVLTGKDPKFAIRASLGCPSEVSVIVLDYHSKRVAVTITTAGGS